MACLAGPYEHCAFLTSLAHGCEIGNGDGALSSVLCLSLCVGLGIYGSDSESEKSPTPGSHLLPDVQGRTIAVIERGDYRDPPERSRARVSRWDSKMREKEGEDLHVGGIDPVRLASSRDELGRASSTADKKSRHRSRSPRDKNKDRSSKSGSSRDQRDSSSSSKSSRNSSGKDKHHLSSHHRSSSK